MKNMIKSLFAVITMLSISAIFSPASAQNGFTPIERRALDKALTAIEDYETLSTLSDDDSYDAFQELFINGDVELYNDLLGLSSQPTLKVKDYATLQRENAKSSQVFVTDIKRESLWQDGTNWKVQFAFDKIVSYTNKCGVYFSTSDFYGTKHHLQAVLVYDSEKDVCKIEKISGKIDSDAKLPENFYTLQRAGDLDKGLKYRGKSITYNTYGQAYLEAPVTKSQFSYSDADVVAIPTIDEECKFVSMKYKARRWAFKFHYDMGMGEPYSLDKEKYNDVKSSYNSFGLDLGYIFPSKSKFKTGLFFGAGISQSKLDMGYSAKELSYSTQQDVNNLEYRRIYNNIYLSQSYKMSDLVIPVYLDFDWHFTKIVSFYLDLGAKINYNLSHKVDATEGQAYVYGVYSQFQDLIMNEHWGYNGFGEHKYSINDLDNPDIADYNAFTVDAFGGAGFRFGIPKVPIYLDFGVSYQYGFMDIVKSNAAIEAYNTTSYNNALIYNTVNGDKSTEHVRNLVEGAGSFKRNQLKFNMGIIFKF